MFDWASGKEEENPRVSFSNLIPSPNAFSLILQMKKRERKEKKTKRNSRISRTPNSCTCVSAFLLSLTLPSQLVAFRLDS